MKNFADKRYLLDYFSSHYLYCLLCVCSEVSVSQLREALLTMDPNKPEADIDQTISVAFSISSGLLIDDTLVAQTDQLAERLGSFPVFRSN